MLSALEGETFDAWAARVRALCPDAESFAVPERFIERTEIPADDPAETLELLDALAAIQTGVCEDPGEQGARP